MIVVSILTYALGKVIGIREAAREVSRQLVSSDADVLPCVRTIQRLQGLDELMVYHGASTTLPKARSRAAHAALAAPTADVWCMIDDDVETDQETLARLLAIARAGTVAVLPCALRSTVDDLRVNVVWDGRLVTSIGGVATRAVARGGCGLMMVPKPALEKVRDAYAGGLSFLDDDGETRVALFAHMFVGEDRGPAQWLGEDYSFCARLRATGIDIAAPVDGRSLHDASIMDLRDAAAI